MTDYTQQFQALDKLFGKTTPTPVPLNGKIITPSKTWFDEIVEKQKEKDAQQKVGQQKTDHPGEVDPSFKASIGGANTILPNIAKTIGNIPSDALGTVGAAVVTPAKNIGDSLKTATDIYKDRGAVQGTKDIAAGFGDTAAKIFKAPGEALVGAADKTDLIDHLSPIQEQAIKQRDTIMQKITDAKKEGKNTSNLVAALKIVQENLSSLNDQIGSKEDRQNKGVEDLTNIAKYPIEHPVQTAIAADTLNPETQATISNTIKPIASKIESGVNVVKGTASDIADIASSKLATRATNKTLDAVSANEQTMTKSQRLQAINEGRQTTTKLGGVEYAPTETEKRAAEILDGKLTGNASKNVPIVKAEIATRGAEAEKYLAKNPVKITAQEQADMFSKARTLAEKDLTETELKAYDEQMKLFLKQIPGRGGYNTETFYKGLKDYESNIADHLPRGKEALLDPTGVASAKIRAASDIRTVVRDAIGERHPEFKPKMFDLASLYDAKGNIIAKAEKIKGNVVTRTLKHPVVRYGLGGTAAFEGAKTLLGK